MGPIQRWARALAETGCTTNAADWVIVRNNIEWWHCLKHRRKYDDESAEYKPSSSD